jgi:hypothetical protein
MPACVFVVLQVTAVRERATGQLYALKALNKRHLIAESAVELVYKERDMLAEIGVETLLRAILMYLKPINSPRKTRDTNIGNVEGEGGFCRALPVHREPPRLHTGREPALLPP